ncbi:DUF302 domain-containing protein [Magnetococcales bacterium HHB-1]
MKYRIISRQMALLGLALLWSLLLVTPLMANDACVAQYPKSKAEKSLEKLPGVKINGPVLQIPLSEETTFEDARFFLESELAGVNLKVVVHQKLGKALAERTGKPRAAYDIYHICNLGIGGLMLDAEPGFGAFMPCKIALYEEKIGGRVWAVIYKPAFALSYFPGLPQSMVEAAMEIGNKMYEVLYTIATD